MSTKNDLPAGIAFTPEDLKRRVEELAPWHYCHQFPYNILTGTCTRETVHPKLVRLLKAGAFPQPNYPNVLDLGANSGIIGMWFCDHKGSHVTAVENGERYFPQLELAIAAKGYTGQMTPIKADIRKMSEHFRSPGGEPFDLVLFLGTMHHIGQEHHKQIFERCFQVLRPGGEFVVQTKPTLPVMELLEKTGFVTTQQLYLNPSAERAAWKGVKPKLFLRQDARVALAQKMGLAQMPEVEFRLLVLEALGYMVLLTHWLRGRFNWWRFHNLVKMEGEIADNDERLNLLGEEYESLSWELAAPRAMLPVLRYLRLKGGDVPDGIEELLKVDAHGRPPMDGSVDIGRLRATWHWAQGQATSANQKEALEDVERRIQAVEKDDAARKKRRAIIHKNTALLFGWMTFDELVLLAEHSRGRVCLEIGSYKGRSTVAMAPFALYIFVVDHFHPEENGQGYDPDSPGIRAEFDENTAEWADKIEVFEMFSQQAAELDWPPLGLVFIDGGHEYETVTHDIAAFTKHLTPGGVVLLHDTEKPDVARAVERSMLGGPDWIELKGVDTLRVFAKR